MSNPNKTQPEHRDDITDLPSTPGADASERGDGVKGGAPLPTLTAEVVMRPALQPEPIPRTGIVDHLQEE